MMFDAGIIVAVIVAINELLKKAGVSVRFIPVISVLFGIAAGYFYLPAEAIQEAIFNGIIIGLASNGLFDVSKVIKPKQ